MRGRQARRWWRRRGRPAWRAARPLAIVSAGVAVLVLGTIGYTRVPGADYDVLDAVYRAFGLFGLSGTVEPPVPVELQIARILGPLVTGYAAVRGLIALSREQLQLAAVRLLARDHMVVAGLGEMGRRLAAAFEERGDRVVALEADAAGPAAAGARERGITVVPGNAADEALLARTGVARARLLFVTCGVDGVNVDAAAAAGELVAGRGRGVLTVFAHLDDLELLRALSAEALTASRRPSIRVEFFNVFATAARLMIERRPPFPQRSDAHVLLVGLEGAGEQLVLHLVNAWRSSLRPGARLRLTLAGPAAEADAAALRRRHPGIGEVCEMGVRELPLDAAQFREGGVMAGADGRCDVDFAYVCLWSEAQALATALALHARPDARGVPVLVAVADADDGVGVALTAEEGRMAGVEPFGVFSEAASPAVLLGGVTEVIARAKHDEYVRAERARGTSPAYNPSMVPWDELPESLRDSNRRFADGIGRKLEATGCALVPAPLAVDGRGPGFAFTAEEVEDLARGEHDRWTADLVRDGWRPTTGPKDPAARLHPLLVPWEELPESERDKDREPIREIPAMLARAGLRVYRAP